MSPDEDVETRSPRRARGGAVRALGAVLSGVLVAVGLAACSTSPHTPEDRARDVAEQWIAAARDGEDDATTGLICAGVDPRTGVNSDAAHFESYTLEFEDRVEGTFFARYTLSYPDSADLAGVLIVSTQGDDACIAQAR